MKRIIKSEKEMEEFGEEFAKQTNLGDTIFLYGELGSGKTTFVKGLAKGLGVERRIISPTFVIVRNYVSSTRKLFHLDLYRVQSSQEFAEIGINEILDDNTAIKAIEWPEKIELGNRKVISLWFEHSGTERIVSNLPHE